MAKNVLGSSTSYTGDASTSLFSISFALGTVNVDQIKVYLDDVLKTNIIDYTIVNNDSQVQFTTTPALGTTIDIRREQDDNSQEVDYQDTKQIKEKNLDNSNKALYYLLHELFDGWLGNRFKLRRNLNANNKKIINIKDATASQDVPSYQQLLNLVNGGTVTLTSLEFDSVSSLQASSVDAGVLVRVIGYYAGSNIGGGVYEIKTSGTFVGTPDEIGDHTLANGNIAELIKGSTLYADQYGARVSNVDNQPNFQAMVDYSLASSTIYNIHIPRGIHKVQSPTIIDAGASEQKLNLSISGDGRISEIQYTTNTTGGALTRLAPARVSGASGTDTDDYDVAAIFIVVAPDSTNLRYLDIDNIFFNASGAGVKVATGIFAPRIALSSFKNLWFENLDNGIEVRNLFLVDMQNVDFRDCVRPIYHNKTASDFGGTSLNMSRVSVASCEYGMEWSNLVYFTFDTVSVEEWDSGNYAWKFTNRSIGDMSGCACENGDGMGFFISGENSTSYASNTIGGTSLINITGGNYSLGITHSH